ncbi:neurogenic locus notch protein [Plakobranchus ocellatus]|uniref:Neurogenic locus notch protein n=1 Tax=Plakobranchus ocellatus TaxID=259542 RepID=A0AAV3WUS5_9GAST|nr:neurogenic locus notch protein [Plakobranchus ocellatus]
MTSCATYMECQSLEVNILACGVQCPDRPCMKTRTRQREDTGQLILQTPRLASPQPIWLGIAHPAHIDESPLPVPAEPPCLIKQFRHPWFMEVSAFTQLKCQKDDAM